MASRLDLSSAISAAEQARTPETPKATVTANQTAQPDGEGDKTKPISLRIRESDHNRFRSLFAKSGLSLSAGSVMAITYVAEMIEAGVFTISRSGIHDIRNWNTAANKP
jgi:hypothetical protein